MNKAVVAATTATEIDPSFSEVRFNLELALEALSQLKEAQKAYLKLDFKSAWADEPKRHLEQFARE